MEEEKRNLYGCVGFLALLALIVVCSFAYICYAVGGWLLK